jgi:nicotinate-nucleotide--dimethylbenzimidazole phosphoribosyltransferase
MTTVYEKTVAAIRPVDRSLTPAIQARLDDLTKPLGSLGRLEELAMRYCLITGTARPRLAGKRLYCFAGDHGVAEEGVSAFPREVTPQMVLNMVAGGAAINVLCRHAGAELRIVDMGVDYDFSAVQGVIDRKVRRGTRNMTKGPAMTRAETLQAIEAGIGLAADARREGVDVLATGEMGIANTTPAAALVAAYCSQEPAAVTGRGTGITDATLANKVRVIQAALDVNRAMLADPVDTLAALGGYEIAGICGLVLGGAAQRMPVVVDGFISSAGALAAVRMVPAVVDYIIPSHLSQERGHQAFMNALEARPLLNLDLRLGEGTGAALAFTLLDASIRLLNEMATFSSAGVSDKKK